MVRRNHDDDDELKVIFVALTVILVNLIKCLKVLRSDKLFAVN